MLRPITLDKLAPVGDEVPADCVVVYPGETPCSVLLVSYDARGVARERRSAKVRRLTKGLVRRMLSRLM